MIVVDASAMVEALVGHDADDELLDALQLDVHAPHLLDVEVLSVLRGLTLGAKLKRSRRAGADRLLCVHDRALRASRARRSGLGTPPQPHDVRRHYLALAEALAAPLYTCDRKLVDDGHGAEVKVLPRTH